MRYLMRLASLAAILAVLTGCPESSAPDVQGVWSGTESIDLAGTIPVGIQGAIRKDGFGFLYELDNTFYIIPNIADQRHLDGAMFSYFLPSGSCRTNPCGLAELLGYIGTAYADKLQLAITSQTVVSGSPKPPTENIGLDRATPYAGTPAVIPGPWQGYYLPADLSTSLDVKADGSFTGTDAYGCAVTGSLIQDQPGSDVFDVTMKGGFSSLPMGCTGDFTGAGYLSSTGTAAFEGLPGTYFYLGLTDSFVSSTTPPLNVYFVEFKIN